MARLIWILLAAIGLVAPAQAGTSEFARNAVSAFIGGYEQFAGEAELQAGVNAMLCASPDAENLAAARNQFTRLVTAWSRVDAIRFGPVLKDNRLDRILFWPDRKSTGLKQVQAAIATSDETVMDAQRLREKSVAMQGIGALEYVLFGTGSDDLTTPQGAHRCAYATAIAQRLFATGLEVANDWLDPNGIAYRLQNPSADNTDYRSESEVLRELVGIWIHGAELMRDTRLAPFFVGIAEVSKPRLALYWRSDLTFKSLQENAAGLQSMFISSGLSDLLDEKNRWVGGSFVFELENFQKTAAEITLPTAEAVQDEHMRAKINYLMILSRSLQKIALEQIATELGVSVGFSALDGD